MKKEIKNKVDKALKSVVNTIVKEHPESDATQYEEALKSIFYEGKLPKDALNISEDLLERLYAYSERLYASGNYAKAQKIFNILRQLSPEDTRFWLGLAASYHKLKNYDMAIVYYYSVLSLDTQDPLPYFYLSDCFEKKDNDVGVMMALNGLITRAGDNAKYASLVERAKVSKQVVEEKILAQSKEE